MVAGASGGKKHVDWELINKVATNLESSGDNGVTTIWGQAIEIANSLGVAHGAWSIIGGAIIGPVYDQTVMHMVSNLGEGQRLHGSIAAALRANAKLWEASEGQNIDNFTPTFAPQYGP